MVGIRFYLIAVLAFVALPAAGWADSGAGMSGGGYFFGVDESNLRRDLSELRFYPTGADIAQASDSGDGDGIVYFGGGDSMSADLWAPDYAYGAAAGGAAMPAVRRPDVQFGLDWRPEITGGTGNDARQISRALAGSDIERIGVRTDVTALMFDGSGNNTPSTAWRISGSLGATSLSLVPGDALAENILEGNKNLLWDVGVGWSSGAISLNAGYLSATRVVEGIEGDMAVLSFGADYSVLPGLSVYGEFNVIDDPLEFGEERLGTVIILGTGLNF